LVVKCQQLQVDFMGLAKHYGHHFFSKVAFSARSGHRGCLGIQLTYGSNMENLPIETAQDESGDSEDSHCLVEVAGDLISDAVTGIPAPIRKNALKAFAQLCTAAIDVPIARLEGAAAEIRAQTKARVALISKSGQKLSDQLTVPEQFAEAASHKVAQKIVREKLNVQKISHIAYEDLKCETKCQPDSFAESNISDDWLNTFEREASTKSSEEMQVLFGKILAGEIRKPSSFSIRTIQLMGQLDSNVAKVFADFCAMTVTIENNGEIVDSRVISPGHDVTSNPLREYGISYKNLQLLQEYGLIAAELATTMDYTPSILRPSAHLFPFIYQGSRWALESIGERKPGDRLAVPGAVLTSVGRELSRVVDVVPNSKYTAALRGFFTVRELKMVSLE
jgi:hypothetical protein